MTTVHDLLALYSLEGAARYGGEAVTQLEHALQCAQLAERAGGTPELIAACLLHDVGHLLMANAGKKGADDVHQYVAVPFLRPLFSEAVLEPIRMHVDAKRYLCRKEKGYWKELSPTSQRTLELQGGIFSAEEGERFRRKPYAEDAIALRRFDDLAKTPGEPTQPLSHYEQLLSSLRLG
ncbi:MAG: HD domain-containing protein [Betaproteobacteria bacterium]|nr:HD domain-containing protein [Betaproteobacteria bacterium]MBV9360693.1 HD domain-containing protein [Betaproteobacteria bacterium]